MGKQTLLAKKDHTHDLRYPRIVLGNFTSDKDFEDRKAAGGTSQEDIFDSWGRFSHDSSGNFPANNSELDAWEYIKDKKQIRSTKNSNTYIGFYSPDQYSDFTLQAQVTSDIADNDRMGIVIAFFKDADGKEYDLSALRDNESFNWRIVYNYLQGSNYGEKVIANGDSKVSDGGNWNNYKNGTTIKVKRTGSIIEAWTSQNDKTELDNNTYLTFDMNDYDELKKFIPAAQYGFSCQSQEHATFGNIKFTPGGSKAFEQYLFNTKTNGAYKLDDNGDYQDTGKKLQEIIPVNMILSDVKNKEKFYLDNSEIITRTTLDTKEDTFDFAKTIYFNKDIISKSNDSKIIQLGNGGAHNLVLKMRAQGLEGWLHWSDANDRWEFKDQHNHYTNIVVKNIDSQGDINIATKNNDGANSQSYSIIFNGSNDSSAEFAIRANGEKLEFYEPEDKNKVHFTIEDDTGVNAKYGYKWNGQSLDTRYLKTKPDYNSGWFDVDSNGASIDNPIGQNGIFMGYQKFSSGEIMQFGVFSAYQDDDQRDNSSGMYLVIKDDKLVVATYKKNNDKAGYIAGLDDGISYGLDQVTSIKVKIIGWKLDSGVVS